MKVVLPRLHRAQQDIINRARRFNVLRCGRRTGKTVVGIDRACRGGGILDGMRVGWFAPTKKHFDEAWDRLVALLHDVIKTKNETDREILLKNGGKIEFWTFKAHEDVARGRHYDRVIIDEAAMVKDLESRWELQIYPTLIDTSGDAWFLSTPKGKNYFSTLSRRDDDEWIAFHFPTHSNPYIPRRELDKLREKMASIVYQQEILAEIIDMSGALVKTDHIQYAEPPSNLRPIMGVDLAISIKSRADYTALVSICYAPETGRIYVSDAVRKRCSFPDTIELIKGRAGLLIPKQIRIEEIQFQAAVTQQLLKTTKLPVKGIRPEKDKFTRFLPIVARYENKMIFHSATLPKEFAEEILSFSGEEDDHDDFVDAFSMAFTGIRLKGGDVEMVSAARYELADLKGYMT